MRAISPLRPDECAHQLRRVMAVGAVEDDPIKIAAGSGGANKADENTGECHGKSQGP
jgi:hypothetical protein